MKGFLSTQALGAVVVEAVAGRHLFGKFYAPPFLKVLKRDAAKLQSFRMDVEKAATLVTRVVTARAPASPLADNLAALLVFEPTERASVLSLQHSWSASPHQSDAGLMRDAQGLVPPSGLPPSAPSVVFEAPREDLLSVLCAFADARPDATVVTDAGDRLLHANTAWVDLCGASLAAAKGRSMKDLLHGPRTDAATATAFASTLRTTGHAAMRITNHHASGQPFTNLVRAHAFYAAPDPDGPAACYLATLEDTSARAPGPGAPRSESAPASRRAAGSRPARSSPGSEY